MVRIPFKQRLEYLDISQGHFDAYVDLFVKVFTKYWMRYEYSNWFQMQPRRVNKPIPLNKYVIVRFLAGEFYLSKEMAYWNDFFCLDLDNRCGTDELYARYRSFRAVLPTPLVIQSSSSLGLHLYYYIDGLCRSTEIKRLLADLLTGHGIQAKPGYIETFPGNVSHLRLPLGKDSMLLDPDTLVPLDLTLRESIEFCAEFKAEYSITQ